MGRDKTNLGRGGKIVILHGLHPLLHTGKSLTTKQAKTKHISKQQVNRQTGEVEKNY